MLGAILLAVERVVPAEFDSVARMRDFLLDAGRTAEIDALREASAEMQPAIAEQRETFRSYVAGLSADDLQAVAPLPYRRVLGIEEIREVWTRLHRRWGPRPDQNWYPVRMTEWYPLDRDGPPDDVLALQTLWLRRAISPARLRRILTEHGVKRVLLLRKGNTLGQYEMDLSLIPPWFGQEAYCTSTAMDWLLYESQESSFTIAGAWLIAEVKRAWPEWEQHHLYTDVVFRRPPQATDLDSPVGRLIDDLLSEESERIERARATAINDPNGIGAPLLAFLRDQNVSILHRQLAIRALVQIGRPIVPTLIEMLGDEDTWIRQNIVLALKEAGDRRAVVPLLRLMRDDSSSNVRAQAVGALGEIGDRRAVAPLIDLLQDATTEIPHGIIIRALGQLKDERAIAPLVKRLAWQDREGVGLALIAIGTPAIPALIGVLTDRSREPAARAQVVHPVIQLHASEAVAPALAILMDRSEAPTLRERMVGLIWALDGWRDVTPLLALVQDRSDAAEVRAGTVRALAWQDSEQSHDLLLRLFADPSEESAVRAAIVLELPRLAPEQADSLLNARDDAEPAVWGAAAETLAPLGDEQTLMALLRLWHRHYEEGINDITGMKVPSPRHDLYKAIVHLRDRLGIALPPEDDAAGSVLAQYGRVRLREPKRTPGGFIDGIPFYIRFVEGSRERELGLFDAPDTSRTTVLKVLRRKHDDLAREVATYERQLADESHAWRAPALQRAIEQQKQQQLWVAAALHELETAPDEG